MRSKPRYTILLEEHTKNWQQVRRFLLKQYDLENKLNIETFKGLNAERSE